MLSGLFINQYKSQCSIYESGVMISNILKTNPNFTLDYIETDKDFITDVKYDFCVVNWHHITLKMDRFKVAALPGLKIGINLEVAPDNYLPIMPPNLFDAYMIIDPTKEQTGNLFPFGRPLEIVKDLREILDPSKIVVGSFGFYGDTDKRFDEVIYNFNKTGEKCIIRFNFPYATFCKGNVEMVNRYSAGLMTLAKSNIDLRITHDYMSKTDLIRWCSEHTINIFPYYRKIPGLSAVTDQAISAGRAIAVTDCDTFRHMHQYISYYPKHSYKELITSTLVGVMKMQQAWHPDRFNEKFDELLIANKILRPKSIAEKPKVLILNHKEHKCGVYQFGKRVYELAARSDKINYIHRELNSHEEYLSILAEVKPQYIVYNWHWDRMPWLKPEDITENRKIKHYFIYHDGTMMQPYDKYLFFGEFDPQKTASPPDKRVLLPRPLFPYYGDYPVNDILTIGSFGFAFNHKKFPNLVKMVNDSFDRAIINIHLTSPYFGNSSGGVIEDIAKECHSRNVKSGIKLTITQDFLDDQGLLTFLAKNDINVFSYGPIQNPGLSSAPDYALSVKRPIAITNNMMFRHIANDDILLEKNSIKDIMGKGLAPIEKYYNIWSIASFTLSMEKLFMEPTTPMVSKSPTKRIMNGKRNFQKKYAPQYIPKDKYLPTVIFINHKIGNCGVYQFGKRVYELLAPSKKVNYLYKEISSLEELNRIIEPEYIVYNWHRATMPWLTEEAVRSRPTTKHCFLFHEEVVREEYDKYFFFGDYDIGNNKIRHDSSVLLPRPLFKYNGLYPKNETFTIGSFGFGFWTKGYHRIVEEVNKEFDSAVINLHMPHSYFGDPTGQQKTEVIKKCREMNVKPDIKLNITEGFLTNQEVLKFLAGNDINAFLYTENGEGLSSATDYALSVRRPIIITDCQMFRHFKKDEILLEKNSIMDVYTQGISPLEEFYEKWSPEVFLEKMDKEYE